MKLIEKHLILQNVQCDIKDFKALQNVGRVQRSKELFRSKLSDPKPVVMCYYFHYFPGN